MSARVRGWLVGVLLLTVAWPGQSFGAPASSTYSVVFTDSMNGLMSGTRTDGRGFVSRTTDGGARWIAAPLTGAGMRVHSISATGGWAVSPYFASPYRMLTSGGSAGWFTVRNIPQPVSGGARAWDIAQVGLNSAVAVGNLDDPLHGQLAAIWKTQDNGLSWGVVEQGPVYPQDSGTGVWPRTLATYVAVNAEPTRQVVYAIGNESIAATDAPPALTSGRGLVARSAAYGGYPWVVSPLETNGRPLEDISAASADDAWVVGGSAVYTTNDGGANWSEVTSATPPGLTAGGYRIDCNSVAAVSATEAIVAGSTLETTSVGAIARTVDGGATWRVYRDAAGLALNDVFIVSPTKAVAVGDNNVMVTLTLHADGTMSPSSRITATNGEFPPKPATALSLYAPSSCNYGSAVLYGFLKEPSGKRLAGRSVSIQYLAGGVWHTIGSADTDVNGRYSFTAKPTSKASFRAVFDEDSTHLGKTSSTRTVLPRVYLTPPSGPVKIAHGVYFSSYGLMKPRHRAGTYPVRVYMYRYLNGRWVYYKSFSARATDYSTDATKYSVRVRLPYAGKWRIHAYHDDANHAATKSSYRFITAR